MERAFARTAAFFFGSLLVALPVSIWMAAFRYVALMDVVVIVVCFFGWRASLAAGEQGDGLATD